MMSYYYNKFRTLSVGKIAEKAVCRSIFFFDNVANLPIISPSGNPPLYSLFFFYQAAVHCHAGLGRTGVLIACYLIYSIRLTSHEAIMKVREARYE